MISLFFYYYFARVSVFSPTYCLFSCWILYIPTVTVFFLFHILEIFKIAAAFFFKTDRSRASANHTFCYSIEKMSYCTLLTTNVVSSENIPGFSININSFDFIFVKINGRPFSENFSLFFFLTVYHVWALNTHMGVFFILKYILLNSWDRNWIKYISI